MVDFWPWAGSFNGVVVSGNTINAAANFMKVCCPPPTSNDSR